jgi:hypothetical protein
LEFPNCLAIIIINYTPAIKKPLDLKRQAQKTAKGEHLNQHEAFPPHHY